MSSTNLDTALGLLGCKSICKTETLPSNNEVQDIPIRAEHEYPARTPPVRSMFARVDQHHVYSKDVGVFPVGNLEER